MIFLVISYQPDMETIKSRMEQLESIREMHHIRNGMLRITVPESFNNKNVEVIVLSLPESSDLEPRAE